MSAQEGTAGLPGHPEETEAAKEAMMRELLTEVQQSRAAFDGSSK